MQSRQRLSSALRLSSSAAALLAVVGFSFIFIHPANITNISVSDVRNKTATSKTADDAKKSRVRNAETATRSITAGAAAIAGQSQVLADATTIAARPFWTQLPLYAVPTNEALNYARANPAAAGAAAIGREGATPIAEWFGEWTPNVQSAASSYAAAAAQTNTAPVLVVYGIPQRDCGGYSSGGISSMAAYNSWVQSIAAGIGNKVAVVVLEPDALAGIDCLSTADQQARYSGISQAVTALKANANTTVYVDAGNPAWQTSATMAARLKSANIAAADGFSLNVSNYVSTALNQSYGDQLSSLTGGKRYVIDTSRNGNGSISPDGWCNAPTAALGASPTTNTGSARNDALLWIKIPWESDGTCNGGPEAGGVFWSFAALLAQNAGW